MNGKGSRPGEVRGVVPLFGTGFQSLSPLERIAVAPGVVLAGLDCLERQRINNVTMGASASSRIEVYGVLPDFPHYGPQDLAASAAAWEYEERNALLGDRIATLVALLSLTVRLHPNHERVLADVWNGSYWVRIGPLASSAWGLGEGMWSYFPQTRLKTWGQLIQHWPSEPTKQLDLALNLYLDSIRERQRQARVSGPLDKAMLSAAVALEVLMGYNAPNELSKTISQRSAHLVAEGEPAFDVYRSVKKVYSVRSKLVHAGKPADAASLTLLQQFLMAALPAVAAAHPMANHDELVEALDSANFCTPAMMASVRTATWARYVPIVDLCRAYLGGRRG